MNSIKFQLVTLGSLFALFGMGVLAQIYYGQHLQNTVMGQIEKGHKVISHFLSIGDAESKITADIRFHIDTKSVASPQETEIESLRKRVITWRDDGSRGVTSTRTGWATRDFSGPPKPAFRSSWTRRSGRLTAT